jgi:peptide deformylase
MRTILPEAKNPALREYARDIPPEEITSPHIRELISDMKALLSKEKHGVALAASQLGEPLKLFIVSGKALAKSAADDKDAPALLGPSRRSEAEADQVYINPAILKTSRLKKDKHEGCLSIRGKWGMVPRAEKATIRAYDENGTLFTRGGSGFLAHVFQHEMDHLNGILYIDKATEIYDEDPERD